MSLTSGEEICHLLFWKDFLKSQALLMLQQVKVIMATNRAVIVVLVLEVEDWVLVVYLVDMGLAEAGTEMVLAAIRVARGR